MKHDAAGVLQHKEESQKELNKEFRNQIIPIPERPPARLLTGQERELLIGACRDEMRRGERDGWNAQATLTALDEFVEFCSLLSKPENHIMVHAGQYVEKPVNRRLVSDMAGEMAQALMRLPQYEAYAKIIQDRAGKKEVVTLRVRTPPPPPEPDWVSEAEVVMKYIKENPPSNFRLTPACQSWKRFIAELVEGSTRNDGICISRDVVEQEIGDRQAKWRKRVKFAGGEPPPPQIEMMPD